MKNVSTYLYPKITVEKLLMWDLYCHRCSWYIQRVCRVAKHFKSSRFDEPLHNGYTLITISCIYCGEQQCFQIIHDKCIRGGGYFPTLSLLFPGIMFFGAGLTPGPATIVMSWEFKFYGIGVPVFRIIGTPQESPFFIPKTLRVILSLVVV